MNTTDGTADQVVLVETELRFSLSELSRACGADIALLESLVHEGVLAPQGGHPEQWSFEGSMLPRARAASRLVRDLELNAAGTALVLELLDEIAALRSQVRRLIGNRN
jgi:chaperone modulatory protein CbpM